MAWTSPGTAVAGTIASAFWNAQIRDDLGETIPAKATTAGAYFVATGSNSVVERIGQRQTMTDHGLRSNTAYGHLTGALTGPRVTATTGTLALVLWGCQMQINTANILCAASVAVSGATTSSGSDSYALMFDGMPAAQPQQGSQVNFFTTLNAGSNTFTMVYRVGSGGLGTFERRRLIVFPY